MKQEALYGIPFDYMDRFDYSIQFSLSNQLEHKLSELELNMIERNTLTHHLPFKMEEINGEARLFYPFSGKRMLVQELKLSTLTQRQYVELCLAILSALENAKQWMLNENHFVLNERFIFVGPNFRQVSLIYLPMEHITKNDWRKELADLVVLLLEHVSELRGNGIQKLLRTIRHETSGLVEIKQSLMEMMEISNRVEGEHTARYRQPIVKEQQLHDEQMQRSLVSEPLSFAVSGNEHDYNDRQDQYYLHSNYEQHSEENGEHDQLSERDIYAGRRKHDQRNKRDLSSMHDLHDLHDLHDEHDEEIERSMKFDKPVKRVKPSSRLRFHILFLTCLHVIYLLLCWRITVAVPLPVIKLASLVGFVLLLCGSIIWTVIQHKRFKRNLPPHEENQWNFPEELDRSMQTLFPSNNEDDVAVYSDETTVLGPLHDINDLNNKYASNMKDKLDEGHEKAWLEHERSDRNLTTASAHISIPDEGAVIGRDAQHAQIQLQIDGLSRLHAEMVKLDESYYILDLGSSNGTLINGERAVPYKKYRIEDGDSLQFVDDTYVFRYRRITV